MLPWTELLNQRSAFHKGAAGGRGRGTPKPMRWAGFGFRGTCFGYYHQGILDNPTPSLGFCFPVKWGQ